MATTTLPRTMEARYKGFCKDCGNTIWVGDLIVWTKGAGAVHETCPDAPVTPATPVYETEKLPSITEATRAGRMLAGGQLDATITLANGEHVTTFAACLRKKDKGWGWERVPVGTEGARIRIGTAARGQRIGWMSPDGEMSWDDNLTLDAKAAVRFLFSALAGECTEVLPVLGGPEDRTILNREEVGLYPLKSDAGWTKIQVANKCGDCGTELTHPESLMYGVGPVCRAKRTKGNHAQIKEG
jgi:hypothetical protein